MPLLLVKEKSCEAKVNAFDLNKLTDGAVSKCKERYLLEQYPYLREWLNVEQVQMPYPRDIVQRFFRGCQYEEEWRKEKCTKCAESTSRIKPVCYLKVRRGEPTNRDAFEQILCRLLDQEVSEVRWIIKQRKELENCRNALRIVQADIKKYHRLLAIKEHGAYEVFPPRLYDDIKSLVLGDTVGLILPVRVMEDTVDKVRIILNPENPERTKKGKRDHVYAGDPFVFVYKGQHIAVLHTNGHLHLTSQTDQHVDEVVKLLRELSADFVGAVQTIGKRFGICIVCFRPLTKAASKDRGVGDMCWAVHFGRKE